MKYHVSFLIIFLQFSWSYTHGQSLHKIDSLKQELVYADNDSTKMKLYESLGRIYRIERTKIDLEVAELYIDSMTSLAKKLRNQRMIDFADFQYGIIQIDKGNYHSALKYMKTFLVNREAERDSTSVSVGAFQIGAIQEKLGNYVASLEAYQHVLTISNARNSDHIKAYVLPTMAGLQRKLDKHDKAIESYNEAIEIWQTLDNQIKVGDCLESLGNTYKELNDFKQSRDYLFRALKIFETLDKPISISSVTRNIGDLYNTMEDHQKALNYYLKALTLSQNLPSKENLASNLNKVGQSYVKLNYPSQAKAYLLRSLDMSEKMKNNPLLMTNYLALAELNKSEGNFKDAYKYQNLFLTVKDSIFNTEKLEQLNELEAKYEASQKDQEIALLTKETELQEKETLRQATIKNAVIVGSIFVILLSSLLFYIFRQRVRNQRMLAKKNNQITEVNYKQQLSDLEMKALRAQMNPHFLFNCLNSINRMILSGDAKEASRYLTKFSRLIRKVLENSEKNMVSLSDELTMLKAYIQLEALRFKGKISYKTDIDRSINLDAMYIPSMVLQPLIENAIWHGLMHKDKGGTIMLTIVKEDNVLKCSVEDDGVGREINQELNTDSGFVKEKSMGLHLTNKRLEIMSELGSERLIKIIDLKDVDNNAVGTRVDLLIPYAS